MAPQNYEKYSKPLAPPNKRKKKMASSSEKKKKILTSLERNIYIFLMSGSSSLES